MSNILELLKKKQTQNQQKTKHKPQTKNLN